jgi:hypothetical protein
VRKRKWLSLLLAVMMLVSAVPLSSVAADAADGTVEVSTWEELKRALEYTTKCSVVKVIADIETKTLNGHTGLHQDNIIFMTMAMDKALDLNGHTVNAYVKYYSEVGQGYLISIRHKDARLTIRDSVGGGALIGEFNQEFYFQFIDVHGGTLVMESGTVKMLCPSKDNQYQKCAISVSGTAIFNGGEVLTQVTSPGGEREERYLSRRLQAIRGESGGSVTINGGTFDRVVLHSTPTPENRGKYELVVNGGFFRQSIAQILVGDVYASHLDHLTMQINDAYFMRTTDKLDPCRLVIGGKMKNFYDRNWDYDLLYNDIPGATLDDAKTMMWGLVPHLISENGAVFTDVHDGNGYVRGNMRRSVENGGPTMAFQGTSLGVQGSIARVISNAYGVKEVLLDGEPMACGERGFSAPQVDTTAESEHRVTFVMYPISSMLRVLGYSYSNEYSTGYIRMLVSDHHTGYGINEGYDSLSATSSDDLAFTINSFVYDFYIRDISTKIRTNLTAKKQNGEYAGAFVAYGYVKDSDDKSKLVVDPFAADVVRDIFRWKIEGLSPQNIAVRLNELGIPSPAEYKRLSGSNYKTSFQTSSKAIWSHVSVRRIDFKDGILTQQEYLLARDVYQREISAYESELQELQAIKTKTKVTETGARKWNRLISRYYKAETVTEEMVEAMVDEIRVNTDGSLDIRFKYMPEFEEMFKECERIRKEVA